MTSQREGEQREGQAEDEFWVLRTTQRNPMWLIPVSIICGWRAAGR